MLIENYGLNFKQEAAIESNAKKKLIIACAGSGKTRTLVAQIIYLIKVMRVSGHEILALTFTRKAANEMLERLKQHIEPRELRKITIGTFHSVAFDIIKLFATEAGYKRDNLVVYNEDDKDDIVKHITGMYCDKLTPSVIDSIFMNYSSREEIPSEFKRELNIFFNEYINFCKKNNALDFNMLLCETNNLIRNHPEVKSYLKNKFQYVLVDEYQDTNQTQYNMHELIEPENLFCVGDHRQAIYGWRGSSVDIILQFQAKNENSEIFYLDECYRCGDKILNAANNLISYNPSPFENIALPKCALDNEINIIKTAERDDAFRKVSYLISQEQDVPFPEYKDYAVIARNHKLLGEMANHLALKNIPFNYAGGLNDIFSSGWSKQIHSIIRLSINHYDELSFIRLFKLLELDRETYLQLRRSSNITGRSLLEEHREMFKEHKFHTFIDALKQKTDSLMILNDCIEYIHNAIFFNQNESLLNSLNSFKEKFIEKIDKMIIEFEMEEISDYMKYYQTRDLTSSSADELNAENKVSLLTAHAAKGLEFKRVFVLGCNNGTFPTNRALKNQAILEEERRLMYVAITRAIIELNIVYWERETDFYSGKIKELQHSAFIEEANLI